MTRKKWLLLGAALILCAFFLHVGCMRPSEVALCRAEALDYLIAQDDPEALETLAPYLEGEAALRGGGALPPALEGCERIGERMLRGEDCLYYVRSDGAQLVVFAAGNG